MADLDARAARKARILASQEKRLKYVTGQMDSLKKTVEEEKEEKDLDEMLNEIHPTTSETQGLNIPTTRVDPAQRRRDAALRKQKQQAKLEERLQTSEDKPSCEESTPLKSDVQTTRVNPPQVVSSVELEKLAKAKKDFIFHNMEQWSVFLILSLAAVVVGCMVNVDGLTRDPRFKDVDDMLAQGFSLDAIKQQMERDHVDISFMTKRTFHDSLYLPENNIPFLPSFVFNMFIPAFVHPPLLLLPILIRLCFSGLFYVARSVLDVPASGDHESDDHGWIVKMFLSQVPMLRDGLRMVKKTGDDFCLVLVILCMIVALRVVISSS